MVKLALVTGVDKVKVKLKKKKSVIKFVMCIMSNEYEPSLAIFKLKEF